MNQVAVVSCRVPSGEIASLRLDLEEGQYVLSRREGDEISFSQVFVTKRDLQIFFRRQGCSKDEEALELMLLRARFFDGIENPSELSKLFSDYPTGLILVGHAAVLMHDKQTYRLVAQKDQLFLECYLSQEVSRSLFQREAVLQIKGFEWCEMFRDSSTTLLYVQGEHTIAIPYSKIEQHASVIDGIRVAAKEHLLALTIDAARKRSGPKSSVEDRKDIAALVLLLRHPQVELLASLLDENRLAYLRSVAKDAQMFDEMFASYRDVGSQLLIWYKERILQFENLVDYVGLKNCQFSGLESEHIIPLDPNYNRLPVSGFLDEAFDGPVTTMRALCESAGVRFRFSESEVPSVVLSQATGNLRARDLRNRPVYVVDRSQFSANTTQEEALRILEVVSYSFGDQVVEQCIHGLIGP
jgi:hypothetical protein